MQVLSLSAQGFQVIVPVNMVAQILGKMPLERASAVPQSVSSSYCGNLSWRDYRVPLFDVSALHVSARSTEDYERTVVLWPLSSAGRKGFMALTSMGPPRVLDIVDQSAPPQVPEFQYMKGCVSLADGVGVIPDLQQLSDHYFGRGSTQ